MVFYSLFSLGCGLGFASFGFHLLIFFVLLANKPFNQPFSFRDFVRHRGVLIQVQMVLEEENFFHEVLP